ncbi:MAG: hypothetical protein KDE19_07820, partial [Caldilineaceae bacterium]|nr:hypothetical protein [Caldilineaceae bacterium]
KPIRYNEGDDITCDYIPNWYRRVADIFDEHVSAETVAGEVAVAWRTEGMEIGEARGIEIGEARGIRQGLLAAIDLGLELKFGETLPAIHQVQSLDALHKLYGTIKTAESLAEIRELLETLTAEQSP